VFVFWCVDGIICVFILFFFYVTKRFAKIFSPLKRSYLLREPAIFSEQLIFYKQTIFRLTFCKTAVKKSFLSITSGKIRYAEILVIEKSFVGFFWLLLGPGGGFLWQNK
jgi:hypothetical protein